MDKKDFISYFENSINDLKEVFGEDISFLTPDHISLQTESADDYSLTVEKYKDDYLNSNEIPHCGRRITIGILKEPFEINGYKLDKLEIVEPKPSRNNTMNKLDHVSYVPTNYAEFIALSKEKGLELFDEVEIGNVVICKWRGRNSTVEFRSSSEFINKNNSLSTSELEKYKNEAEENKQKALRALADYQNLKKRVEIERDTIQFYANTTLISKLLDIRDDFARADDFVKDEKDLEKIKTGYIGVKSKLDSVINDFGLEEIKVSVGDKFNPETMEAIGTFSVEDENQVDSVMVVAQKGYKYLNKNQIVRHVRVMVGKMG